MSKHRERRVDAALMIVGLLLGGLGQVTLVWRRDYVWDGVLFWVGGLLCLGWMLRRSLRAQRGIGRARGFGAAWRAALTHQPVRVLMMVGGISLSFLAGGLARQRAASADHADVLVLWTLGVASFLVACQGWDRPWKRQRWNTVRSMAAEWLTANRVRVAGMVCLLLVAGTLRAYDLEHIPANLGGDEGTQGAAALEIVASPLGNPFSTGWFSVPTMSFLAYGISMRLFGATIAGLRALSALVGTATVLTTFLLGRALWGECVAWLSAAALAFSHYHVHFSRLGSNQIADGLFVTLSLWLIVRGLRTKRWGVWAAAGAVVGLGWYAYFGARLVCVIVAGYLMTQVMVSHRFLARHRRMLLVMVVAAVVVAAPLLLHYAAHPTELTSRPNQVSIFASGWLARERELTGRSTLSLLAQQFWRSISAFNHTLDPTFFYRPSVPLLDVVSGLLFVLGLVWTIAHYRRPSSLLLLIWFWLALGLGWVMTENPPSSQRMVILAPALALFVGLGLNWVVREVARLGGGRERLQLAATAGSLALIAALNVRYYFFVYTPTRVYGNPTAEMATALARQLEESANDHRIYFHGPPFVYWEFGTLEFMARDEDGVNVPPVGESEPPTVDASRGARFVFHPERAGELSRVRERCPGGETVSVHSTADGDLLYTAYEVDAAEVMDGS